MFYTNLYICYNRYIDSVGVKFGKTEKGKRN